MSTDIPGAVPSGPRPVRAPRGTTLSTRGWQQEAVLRMLMNNLDPEVAENPDELVVYGGTGRAARSWPAFDAIVRELRSLADDETLLVQSGKPVAVFRTNEWAPRVLIANSNLVGKWANWDVFRDLERKGLTMYGQMTAGSWIYIGTQGILQGTYETFAELARQHFGGTLRGRVVLTAGLGGMGGAQPLSVTMNEGVCIAIEVDETRARRRHEIGYVDRFTHSPQEALAMARQAAAAGDALSIALIGNAAEIEPAWAKAGEYFDVVTDQTSAHDALGGYVPAELTLRDAHVLRITQPDVYMQRSVRSMADHVRAILAFKEAGAVAFDYGNNLRAQAQEGGVANAFDYPGFVPAYIRPLFCEGKGPFRWVALSGDPADIRANGPGHARTVPARPRPAAVARAGGGQGPVPGPAGADLLAGLRRAGQGRAALQRDGGVGRIVRPDRDRTGPPRRGLRGVAKPRDGGDARRVGRHRRLAAAERPGQHRGGRDLGVDPSRRRHRDRLFAARRDGRRGGRHRAGGTQARAGAHLGSRDGRGPARGRGLRARDRGRPGARRPRPDAGGVPDATVGPRGSALRGSARRGRASRSDLRVRL